jgi:hypothetical protein
MTDLLLHAVAGAAISYLAIQAGAHPALAILLALVCGTVRESHQRDWENPLRFTAHAWTEAAAWGIGGLLAAAIVLS